MSGHASTVTPFKQPKAVWAVAFACVISFMGIGLVDPILPALADQLQASPSQVSLLFTSYLLVTAVAMLGTGWVSSRIGAKPTLVAGLALIIVFAALAGSAGSIGGIVGFRAGWGLGNALFIATSLAVIVGSASGGFAGAIVLYETALGVGIAIGPLLGGLLGAISWRLPFFGVAVLMALALVATMVLVSPPPRPARPTSLVAPFQALRHRGLLTLSLMALAYNWGFFTLLAYTPYPMRLGAHALGLVFTGWGAMVAIFAVFGAPRLQARFGTVRTLYGSFVLMAADLVVIAVFTGSRTTLIAAVIVAGAFIGLNNTLVTSAVMTVSTVDKPVASAAYSFVRFLGGGIAPFAAGLLAEHFNVHVPFFVGAGALLIAALILATGARLVTAAESPEPEVANLPTVEGTAIRAGVPVVVAVDRSVVAPAVTAAAARIAEMTGSPVELLHVRQSDVVGDDVVDLESADEAAAAMEERLAQLAAAGVPATGQVLSAVGNRGAVGTAIAAHANRVGAQLVVIGPPSGGGLAELFDGSVTAALWRQADCDVLLVNGDPELSREALAPAQR